MSPDLRVRLSAKNDTKPAFDQVARDANAAASTIEAAGGRASRALTMQGAGLGMLGRSSAAAANQQRNLAFQLNDVAVSLASGMNPLMVFAQQGSQIATIYGSEEGGLGRAFKETGNLAVGLVSKFWPVAVAVGIGAAAIGGLTSEINKASDVQVTFGDVALAVWQEFSDGIYNFVKPAIDGVAGWIGGIWETVQPSIVALGNNIVGTFVFAYDAAKIAWGMLPTAMGDITFQTANAVINGVESMINGSIGLINDFTRGARGALGAIGIDVGDIGQVDFGNVDNPFAGYADEMMMELGNAASGIGSVDYMGQAFGALTGRAQENARNRLADQAKGAAKALEPLDLGLKKTAETVDKLGESLAGSLSNGVMSVWQAFRSGGSVLEAVGNQLMSFADQLLGNAVQSFFSSIFGGGFAKPSFVGYGFGSYGKFATGGDFTVGGSGGTDSQLVSFMATPGERVSVRTPAQADGGGGGQVNNFYIDAKGAEIGVEQKIVQAIRTMVPQMIKSQAPAAVAATQRNGGIG